MSHKAPPYRDAFGIAMDNRHIFKDAMVISWVQKNDARGTSAVMRMDELALPGFEIKEQRIYSMPKAHTFFGIHFQTEPCPQDKLITVIQGAGLDYIIDLRKDSPTFAKWQCVELTAENALSVYIPQGFGHAFLSTRDDTIQLFQASEHFIDGYSQAINCRDTLIALDIPRDIQISEKDRNAPFLNDLIKNKESLCHW